MGERAGEGGRGWLGSRYCDEITARARAHWTPERVRAVLGDKALLLPPVESAPLLRAIGLLRGDGSMAPESVRKYMQVNHMVALLEPAFLDLAAAHEVVRVLDAGCGASVLTEVLAWCFVHRWRHRARILGVDRNEDLVERSRERAAMTRLDGILRFETGTIDDVGRRGLGPVEALIALHACDTATDDALALGVELGADLIAVAPWCHGELARRWAELHERALGGPFAPLRAAPHLRREAAATVTDLMRALLLGALGYSVTAAEFVPSPHTPKNTLLRARQEGPPRPERLAEYAALCEATGGAGIGLEGKLGLSV